MNRLTVLTDAQCGLCRNCRAWLERQVQWIPLEFLDHASPEVDRRYPGLRALRPEEQMIVVADTGELWQGEAAWLVCLHALRDYRDWAARCSHPLLRPLAGMLYRQVSTNRHGISKVLGLDALRHERACPPEPGQSRELVDPSGSACLATSGAGVLPAGTWCPNQRIAP